MIDYPFVVTVSSEKGGVGKTTLATNLAIFLKALNEELPVSILSFDNHLTIDKMFEIKGQQPKGDVADFLRGKAGVELLLTGQYGVGYIPSSRALDVVKETIKGPLALARLFSFSNIPGILIVDTRPDLDILTRNAIFSADRVIIPVKDMASLENCRNIFDLFDKKGFDKKSLSLIPSIIDSRIKFNGPFLDQRSLLKAYAINRGYHCYDTFISKSPKVESLATNPTGKIYPVLTHARNTEVFSQFTKLARILTDEFNASSIPRSLLFDQWHAAEKKKNNSLFVARHEGLIKDCIFCNRPIINESGGIGYFFEASDGSARGFFEEECFTELLLSSIFNLGNNLPVNDPKRMMLKEATKLSAFVFRSQDLDGRDMVEFIKFNEEAKPLMKKHFPLKEYEGGVFPRKKGRLFTMMKETMANISNPGAYLVVKPVSPDNPESILQEENYSVFSRLKEQISRLLDENS
jgi:cellulose biosynthesis protein BcsQ